MTYAGEDKVEEQRWNELLAAVARAMEKPPGGGSGTRVTSRRGDYRYRNVRVLGYGGEGVVLVAQRLSPDRPTQDPTTLPDVNYIHPSATITSPHPSLL